ncbi:TonB-dependent receptor [Gluconobacter wancherniae]|uniref:TonB-dependent receptor n=1 Tax=Gluconobacter wancherniae TaxID=1307955 RepID=UPI001B8B5B6F|nr:TonB-dependent receptor [Gluconobacter wancherniae]MBS1089912.1 TonB-dependent receptor [Gluconobacter wancherniae]
MRLNKRLFLLAGCMMVAGNAHQGLAQGVAPSSKDKASGVNDAGAVENKSEYLTVIGGAAISATGVTGRQVGGGLIAADNGFKSSSTVSRDFIAKQSPTQSAFQMLKYEPGANAAASDPFNMQFGGGGLSVRGLDSSQMGFVYEGIPVTSTYNGQVNPAEWADTENLERVKLDQGAPDISTPTVNASGGVVTLFTRDPSTHFHVTADATGGSYSMARGFARLDTGYLGNSGIRIFMSVSQSEADHVRGAGHDSKTHFDLGALKEWGNGNRSKLTISFGSFDISNYNYPNQAQFAAGSAYNYTKNYANGTNTSYYKLHSNPYEALLVSLPTNFNLGHHLKLNVTPYTYYNYGDTGFGGLVNENAVYTGTSRLAVDLNGDGTIGGRSMTYQPYIEETSRTGVNASLVYATKHNTLTFGYWFQYENDNLFSQYGRVSASGSPLNAWGDSDYYTYNGKPIYLEAEHSYVMTNVLYISDTLSLLHDHLKIMGGFREAMVNRQGVNSLPGVPYHANTNNAEPLPMFGATYTINRHHQFYANASTAFRAPSSNVLFASTYNGKITSRGNSTLQPEYSITEELGYRYTSDLLMGRIAFFNYNFTNRLVSTQEIVGSQQLPTEINAGGQHARGVDFELGTAPIHHFRPYISAEYLDARQDNNMLDGADYLPTKGKHAIQAPKYQLGFALDYDDGHLFGNAGVKWVGRQYSTFMNDQSIAPYVQADFTAGYRFRDLGPLKKPEFRLNVINAANNHYLSGVYSAQTNARATRGVFGSNLSASGAPRYYVSTPFMAMVTVSAGF